MERKWQTGIVAHSQRAWQIVNADIRIVLVETSHPGNMGATARAMKTMGLERLVLVRPKHPIGPEAVARAAGADSVLAAASFVDTLGEAVGDCRLVIGTTARQRSVPAPLLDPRQCADLAWQRAASGAVAIVFGPEQSGLSNEDLALCQRVVHIPTGPDFGSLNLAMAVQVICYELRMAWQSRVAERAQRPARVPASSRAYEGFQAQLEELLVRSGFLHADHHEQMRLKLRRLFQRAELDDNEINILRGVLTSLDPLHAERRRASVAAEE